MISTKLMFHIINLCLMGYAAFYFLYILSYIRKCKCPSSLKIAVRAISVFGMTLAVSFIALQMDWLIQEHNITVGESTAWGWLVFDYCLSLFLISVCAGIHIYCKCKVEERKAYIRKRRNLPCEQGFKRDENNHNYNYRYDMEGGAC